MCSLFSDLDFDGMRSLDATAWKEARREIATYLHFQLQHREGNRSEIEREEIAERIFIELIGARERLCSPAELRKFLKCRLDNRPIDYARTRWAQAKLVPLDEPSPTGDHTEGYAALQLSTPDSQAEEAGRLERLRGLVLTLPDNEREFISAVFDTSTKDFAEKHGLTQKAVEYRKYKILGKLKRAARRKGLCL